MAIDLGAELEESLAHVRDTAILISVLNGLVKAQEETGDGRLVNPELLTLLMASVVHVLRVGESRDFRLELTVHIDVNHASGVAELRVASHGDVERLALDVEFEVVISSQLQVEHVDEALHNALGEVKQVVNHLHEDRVQLIDDFLPDLLLGRDSDVANVELGRDGELPVDSIIGGGDGIEREV